MKPHRIVLLLSLALLFLTLAMLGCGSGQKTPVTPVLTAPTAHAAPTPREILELKKTAAAGNRGGVLPNNVAGGARRSDESSSSNPGVVPQHSRPYGKTYGEWVVAYWQWAMSIPGATNPWFNDPTGAYAAIGQAGPVWFLGGSLGSSVTRDITIPAGKSVLLPVHQWIFGAMAFDCDPSVPGVTCDVPSLQASAAAAAEAVALMEVTIDGQEINEVVNYRTRSPSAFSVTVSSDNLVTFLAGPPVPAGTYGPQVADGYYLLLAPLSAGQHTISSHVVSTLGFEYDHTYNITVSP